MGIVVDIIIVALLALGAYMGARKGLIKTLVGFVGLVAIVIISYTLKTPLANFMIDKMPFFNFGGVLEGITSLNILLYNIIAFIVMFIILYCVLNVVLAVTGFVDTLLKFTVIWIIPSKIGGAILGLLETWVYLFLVLFVLTQFNVTNNIIGGSKVKDVMFNYTPVIGTYLAGARVAAEEIYVEVKEYTIDEEHTKEELNLWVLQKLIERAVIDVPKANELMETGKLDIKNVMIAG